MAGRLASAASIKKNIHRCKHTDETDETGFVGFVGVLRRTKNDFRSPILAALRFISLSHGRNRDGAAWTCVFAAEEAAFMHG